jgi:hypothetical protein
MGTVLLFRFALSPPLAEPGMVGAHLWARIAAAST